MREEALLQVNIYIINIHINIQVACFRPPRSPLQRCPLQAFRALWQVI